MSALPQQTLEFVTGEHVVGRSGAADDDIHALKLLHPSVEADGAASEFCSQRGRPVVRTV